MILDGGDPAALDQAVEHLCAGGLVGLPTETVYGLGADAGNDAAVRAIFAAKGRPADHPLIVHVAEAARAVDFARDIPDFAHALMQAFWPGPLTVIVPRRDGVAALAAAGQSSIGLRCPAHPVAQALLRGAARRGLAGVAAPSANRFGRISATTAQHVAAEFGDPLLVLDGGACAVGIESVIVDCTRGMPVLLRPGMLTPELLAAACGQPVWPAGAAPDGTAPRAPGTLAAHYAPRARLRVATAQQLQGELDAIGPGPGPAGAAAPLAVYARAELRCPPGWLWRRMPTAAAAAAHELFAALRAFDDAGASAIWVEAPPPGPDWDGVRDRLLRAAASASAASPAGPPPLPTGKIAP